MILSFKINRVFLLDSAFIKPEIAFRNFIPTGFLATWGFPAHCFGLLTNENEGNHAT